jgi:hypothetical protein
MIVFRITAEPDGWWVCSEAARSGPCLSRRLAVERAEGMAQALRAHGECASVDGGDGDLAPLDDQPRVTRAAAS